MRTAIFSVVAAYCVLGFSGRCIAQEAPKPKPAEPAAQTKPVPESQPPAANPTVPVGAPSGDQAPKPATPPAVEADPSKMAAPAAPVSSGAQIPKAAPVDTKSYVLGAEDMIFITVWRSADFTGQHMIRPDGKITLNLVGEVEAAGLTPEALGANIRERLRKVLVEPDVSVAVTAVNSKRYFIQGEVKKPGEYKLVVPTRVLEALVNAGGFNDFANMKKITIMRGIKRFTFNYKAVIAGKSQDENIYLEPGDLIIVK